MFFEENNENEKSEKMINVTDDLRHNFPWLGESVLVAGQMLRCWPTLKCIERGKSYFSRE